MLSLRRRLSLEKAYWLDRKRASIMMARSATCSAARLTHYDLAGRYSLNAMKAEAMAAAKAVEARPTLYAGEPGLSDA